MVAPVAPAARHRSPHRRGLRPIHPWRQAFPSHSHRQTARRLRCLPRPRLGTMRPLGVASTLRYATARLCRQSARGPTAEAAPTRAYTASDDSGTSMRNRGVHDRPSCRTAPHRCPEMIPTPRCGRHRAGSSGSAWQATEQLTLQMLTGRPTRPVRPTMLRSPIREYRQPISLSRTDVG